MHKDLEKAFSNLVDILKKDERCKGGWQYGSVSRNDSDIYSDYDLVFLVENKYFNEFAEDAPKYFKEISDELLIFWGEPFNDDHFKNYCSIIRLGENLHQLDFFIINSDFPEEWMCKQHAKGCTKENIIFDRTGEVEEYLAKGHRTDNYIPDTIRAIDTYWFHIEMLIKYFKRKDMFKLIKNIVEFNFHSHIDLLLSYYDTLDWGAWESKVKHCVPKEKQEHLLYYFQKADYKEIENGIRKAMKLFYDDSVEILKAKGITYDQNIAKQIMEYFDRRLKSKEW